jgi:hypothetical protein
MIIKKFKQKRLKKPRFQIEIKPVLENFKTVDGMEIPIFGRILTDMNLDIGYFENALINVFGKNGKGENLLLYLSETDIKNILSKAVQKIFIKDNEFFVDYIELNHKMIIISFYK